MVSGITSTLRGEALRLSSERLRAALAGIELADSLTIDAHKWFATTMGCGMFVSRDAAVLSEAFQVGGDFMPSNASNLDPYLNTVQWSRRFLGLRLFLALAVAGWRGYGAHVERAVEVIEQVKVTARGAGVVGTEQFAAGSFVRCTTGGAGRCPRDCHPPVGFGPGLGGTDKIRRAGSCPDLRHAR